MAVHLARVLDASAMVGLFAGRPLLMGMLTAAHAGRTTLLLPTTCIAEAEAELMAGPDGWEAILLTYGVRSLPLSEHAAIEIASWPGLLSVRHAAHEAWALRSVVVVVVVTCHPSLYEGLRVSLSVV